MSLTNNFPTTRPSLLLNFAKVKRLDPRITFTRTTTATYYDGETVAKAEENLIVGSENFRGTGNNFTPLNLTSVGVVDVDTAPDGTLTADALTATTTNGSHRVRYGIASAATYTFSVFVKPNGLNYVALSVADNITNAAVFNITSGSEAVQSTNGTATNAAISQSANGYWRISVTLPLTTSGPYIVLMSDATTTLFAGNDTDGIFVWGAQLEQRSAVTAYTATTTQPITNYIPVLLTAPAGVARFDHNPVTEESLGLLVEEQRTNLQTYSAEFDNAAWTKTRSSIISNTIVAPDGTLTGDKLVENTDTDTHLIFQGNNTFSASQSVCGSVYIKAGERTFASIGAPSGSAGTGINLTTGELVNVNVPGWSNATTRGVIPVGNGWYRVYFVFSATGSSGLFDSLRIFTNNGTTTSYTGDGYSGIYIWGAQLEEGAFPTSYIPTVASQVTRSADAASMTGTNFSSWFNNAEGTFYTESSSAQAQTNSVVINCTLNPLNIDDAVLVRHRVDGINFTVRVGATDQAFLTRTTLSPNTFGKFAGSYAFNNIAAVLNGGAAGTDTTATIPSVVEMQIGRQTNGAYLSGCISKLAYYKERLSNEQLQALTGS